jgi:hypothetical protein
MRRTLGAASLAAVGLVLGLAPLGESSPAGPDRAGSVWNGDIYVVNADGSGKTRLTRHPAEEFDPAWSPDGTKIAYASSLDRVAPQIGLTARKNQSVRKQKGVIVKASCDEACTLSVTGTITIAGQRAKVRLKRASGRLDTPGRKMFKLALSRSAARRVARLIARGKSARALISVRAVDLAGNAGRAKRTVTLRQ